MVIGHVPVGRRPYAVGLTKTCFGFSTDQYGGTITVFDLATLKPVKTIEACDHPEGIALDTTRNTIYVACWFDNVLLTLDPEKLVVTGKIAVGDGPRAFGEFLK